ncbi:polysaccharide biosynthesis protein [Camelliibacillus cellulosilyticus]|uniref:Polysaccharide biosynthesis protein n=1 Tax=Camelliibacillus cellulosilyticus TaxID=2174486 RepID=A0ABV9GQ00_9BACL
MTYRKRLTFFICLDSAIVLTAIFLGCFLVYTNASINQFSLAASAIVLLISHHIFSYIYKLYKKAWGYASAIELWTIFKAVTGSIVLTAILLPIITGDFFIRLFFVTWMLHLFFIGGSRFAFRIVRDTLHRQPIRKKRTLIVGAGSAGLMVARQLLGNKNQDLLPVGFIDDDVKKQKLDILGIPVVGGVHEIAFAVQTLQVDQIIIAIPSLNQRALKRIVNACSKTRVKTQAMPKLEDLVTGKVSVSSFRDVEVEDLLGREPVELDIGAISDHVTGKIVLVTGAGGSIGSEICRQLMPFKPRKLIMLGHGENSIYSIEMALKTSLETNDIELVPVIADIQDAEKIAKVMAAYRPDIVYHAAAHKHVPLMERHPDEAVKNNVLGTFNLAEAASVHAVKTFVMISSDKAVNPTSVMGATKRLAEMVIQHFAANSSTTFVAVRFGNVLGSRGSVVPLFKKQIQNGGPVTITHPNMVRYFMTIPEASRLVIQAGACAKGGEIFVLDMGEPVKIVDLAKNLIQLSGHTIEDIGIEYTGIRPGEKLFEELLNEQEIIETAVHPKIYIGQSTGTDLGEILAIIDEASGLEHHLLRERLLAVVGHSAQDTGLLPASS